MTRLVTCGWETGDVAEVGTTGGNVVIATSTPTPRSPGIYCMKIPGGGGYRFIDLVTPKSELWIRFAYFLHGQGASNSTDLLTMQDSNANSNSTLIRDGNSGTISLTSGSYQNVPIATSTLALSQDQWHVIEVRFQATSTSSGTSEVWVDETRWINFTGDNTLNQANWRSMYLGPVNYGVSQYAAYDDLAINDTNGTINNAQIHDGRVVFLKPNGSGSNTQLTRGGTDTGANWSQTNELPMSMTQYVQSSTPGQLDTYAMDDVPTGTWTVNSCEVIALAQNSDIGTGSIAITVKSGATTSEGTTTNMAISPQLFRRLLETDPNTGLAWTVAALSAVEIGATVR